MSSKFIEDFKVNSPDTKIRLIGHSLGSQVILSTLEYLSKKKNNFGIVEGVYFFGASITEDIPSSKKYGKILHQTNPITKTKNLVMPPWQLML